MNNWIDNFGFAIPIVLVIMMFVMFAANLAKPKYTVLLNQDTYQVYYQDFYGSILISSFKTEKEVREYFEKTKSLESLSL